MFPGNSKTILNKNYQPLPPKPESYRLVFEQLKSITALYTPVMKPKRTDNCRLYSIKNKLSNDSITSPLVLYKIMHLFSQMIKKSFMKYWNSELELIL